MGRIKQITSKEEFVVEVITFPGYASVLLGWLIFICVSVYLFASLFVSTSPPTVPPVQPEGAVGTGVSSAVVLVIVAISAVVLALVATWVYVARWTKSALIRLARLLRVKDSQFWSFCVSVLIIGWLLTAGLSFASSDSNLIIAASFTGAIFIAVGSASFGLANLKKIKSPDAETPETNMGFSAKSKKK